MKHMAATSNSCFRNYNLPTQADKINQVSDSSQDKPVVCFDISELFSTTHLFTRKCCQNFHLPRKLNIPTCCITFDYIILTEKWVTPSLTHPMTTSDGYILPFGEIPNPTYPLVFTCNSNVIWVALNFQKTWNLPTWSNTSCNKYASEGTGLTCCVALAVQHKHRMTMTCANTSILSYDNLVLRNFVLI